MTEDSPIKKAFREGFDAHRDTRFDFNAAWRDSKSRQHETEKVAPGFSASLETRESAEIKQAVLGAADTLNLLPCPFCGAQDVHAIAKLNHTEAACFQCGAVAHADTWNKRASAAGSAVDNKVPTYVIPRDLKIGITTFRAGVTSALSKSDPVALG